MVKALFDVATNIYSTTLLFSNFSDNCKVTLKAPNGVVITLCLMNCASVLAVALTTM